MPGTFDSSAMSSTPWWLAPSSPQSGLHVLAQAPYLRNLAVLVLLGTIGAALADYVFKAQAVDAFGRTTVALLPGERAHATVAVAASPPPALAEKLALAGLPLAAALGVGWLLRRRPA